MMMMGKQVMVVGSDSLIEVTKGFEAVVVEVVVKELRCRHLLHL